MCECYRVGGPFISEDPSCPVHGSEAMSRQKTSDERIEELLEVVASLHREITQLREEMRREIAQLRKNTEYPL